MSNRTAVIRRKTTETEIELELSIDGTGKSQIKTGIGFFDHMLTAFSRHSLCDLRLICRGDLEVDGHHTVEDCGLALGQAFREALGDKRGLRRYGTGWEPVPTGELMATVPSGPSEAYVPMDECLARCVIDFGGRPYFVWRGLDSMAYRSITDEEKTQDASTAFRFGLAREFFQGFTNEARCNLHLELMYGDEPHHVVESLFKAFARAVDFACQRDGRIPQVVPSSKGVL